MQLRRFLTLVGVALVLVAAPLAVPALAEEAVVSAPLLAVTKTVSANDVVLGSRVDVRVVVTNVGLNTAYDVAVHDLKNDGSERVERAAALSYGESLSFGYSLTPTALGSFPVSLARVTYNVEQGNDATARTAYSNAVREETAFFVSGNDDESRRGAIGVLTRAEYDRAHSRYVREIAQYVFLGVTLAAAPFALYRHTKAELAAFHRASRKK